MFVHTIQPVVKPVVKPVVQPGLTTVLNEQLFVQHGCQTGCQTRLTTVMKTGWIFVYTIQSVVSCKRGLTNQCVDNVAPVVTVVVFVLAVLP